MDDDDDDVAILNHSSQLLAPFLFCPPCISLRLRSSEIYTNHYYYNIDLLAMFGLREESSEEEE